MIAIVGGLVAAAMWAASALCISRSTKMISPVAVLGWVLLIGSLVSVAAVLGSQFAAMAAIAAFVLFRERLARVQVVGVAVIAVGVAVPVLTAMQA